VPVGVEVVGVVPAVALGELNEHGPVALAVRHFGVEGALEVAGGLPLAGAWVHVQDRYVAYASSSSSMSWIATAAFGPPRGQGIGPANLLVAVAVGALPVVGRLPVPGVSDVRRSDPSLCARRPKCRRRARHIRLRNFPKGGYQDG
jgi:hypothetical protein